MAIQGPVVRWVADHRKHHKFSDRDGDPHSPWKYGSSVGALWKGLWHAPRDVFLRSSPLVEDRPGQDAAAGESGRDETADERDGRGHE